MLKRIAGFMVMLSMIFAFQGNVWAAVANAETNLPAQQTEIIALAENPQMAALNEDLQLLGATGFGGIKIEPWFWILSIIPGLGQFLMGDVVRGVLFFLAPTILTIAYVALGTIFATNTATAGIWGIVGLLLPLISLGIWIWNLVDAYFMNQAKVGMSSIDPMQQAAEMHEKLAAAIEVMKKNQIVSLEGGIGVNSQLATF